MVIVRKHKRKLKKGYSKVKSHKRKVRKQMPIKEKGFELFQAEIDKQYAEKLKQKSKQKYIDNRDRFLRKEKERANIRKEKEEYFKTLPPEKLIEIVKLQQANGYR